MRSTDFTIIATAPTQLYTLSLHDALPICVAIARHLRDLRYAVDRDALSADRPGIRVCARIAAAVGDARERVDVGRQRVRQDRKSTRLNSSHVEISYAVFCLQKKTTITGSN